MSDLPLIRRARVVRIAALVGIGAVSALMFLLQAAPSRAATAAHAAQLGVSGPAGNNHRAAHVAGSLHASLGPGTHYLYAQDGTCPDGIDVYEVAGTGLANIQNVAAGCEAGTFFGNHHLAVVRTPANCLIFSSDGDGNVYSFTINPSTGMLSTWPASSVTVGGFPGDLAVSGSTVFESNIFGGTIDVLTVGSGCALTLRTQNSTGPEFDINIALANPTTVVSADLNSGDMVAYTLQPNDTLVETVNDPGQIANPDSVAVLSGNVYTGQATGGPPQTQGFSFDGTAYTPLAGSPQTSSDPSSINGAAVAGSTKNHLLAQADQYSGHIGWDSVTGTGMA
jgi:hypothetical protein